MSSNPLIRAMGADHRNTLAANYAGRGADFGYKLAVRFLEEGVAEIAEAHGHREAYQTLLRIGDRLVADRLLGDMPMPGVIGEHEEPTPALKAAIAAHAPAPPTPPAGAAPDIEVASTDGVPHTFTLNVPDRASAARALHRAAWILEAEDRATWPRWRQIAHHLRPAPWLSGALTVMALWWGSLL